MERLSMDEKFSSLEASIHLARYNMALQFCSGKKVLDVACGEGYGSFLISNANSAEVVGVDVDKKSIEKAKKNFKNSNLKYMVSDAINLSQIQDNYFDVVISYETFEHVKNVDLFLKEVSRVSKNDAIIMITCPNDYFYYEDNESNPFHFAKYHFNEFKDKCEKYLGKNVNYFAGMHCEGFLNYDCENMSTNRIQKDMLSNDYKSNSFVVPSESKINYDDCNYYIGVWNYNNFVSNNVIYPTNNNKDILKLINKLNKEIETLKMNHDSTKFEEIERFKQLYNLTKEELNQLRKYNHEQHKVIKELSEKAEYWQQMYNIIVNSKTYRYARKLVKLVKKS